MAQRGTSFGEFLIFLICMIVFFYMIANVPYFFSVFLGLVIFLYILFRYIIPNIRGEKLEKMPKELQSKVKEDLKIDHKYWRKQSLLRKWVLYEYSKQQVKAMKMKGNMATKTIKPEVRKEWENLSLEQRIKRIDKYNAMIERSELNKYKKKETKISKRLERKYELERERQLLAEQKLKKQREEDERRRKAEKLKQEEIERQKQELERIQEEEKLKIQRKKQREIDYKERIKRKILKKEREKQLASEAIQELIDNGLLSEDSSNSNNRSPIPSHVKQAVWMRDKGCCVSCGSKENLEFDHIIPFSKGGNDSIKNLQILCLKCNRGKSNKIL